jgi:hypothetical protein
MNMLAFRFVKLRDLVSLWPDFFGTKSPTFLAGRQGHKEATKLRNPS